MQFLHGGHVGEVDGGVVIDGLLGARGVELTGALLCVSLLSCYSYNRGVRFNIPRECIAVDSSHGNAKGPGLQDVVVGEAFHELRIVLAHAPCVASAERIDIIPRPWYRR